MAYCEKKDSKDYVFHVTSDEQQDIEDPVKPYGAFDPIRKEIDWDCPCIGGAMKGPCAEDFKRAFSCFVMSEEADKGSDCAAEFIGMNKCFGENQEYYEREKREEQQRRREAGEEVEVEVDEEGNETTSSTSTSSSSTSASDSDAKANETTAAA